MTLTEEVVFTPTEDVGGWRLYLIVKGAFTDPSSIGVNYLTEEIRGTMTISDDGTNAPDANGVRTADTGPTTSQAGYVNFNVGTFVPGDLLITFSTPTTEDALYIAENSSVTLSDGTYVFEGSSTPLLPDFTTAQIYMADGDLNQVSGPQTLTMIPEPSASMLGFLGSALFLLRRKR
ncbi:hypothetical protein [Roseibacillus ishigakijimensis]|nr:hypothetical protein [Roseibacillus ishigakijimensis]